MIRIALLLLLFSGTARVEADWVVRGATIYDGSGMAGVVGDVAVRGDEIIAVGSWIGAAKKTVDGRGLVVTPGFIDLHSHSDGQILREPTRDNYNFTSQGCTTIVTGNCGGGNVDVAVMFTGLETHGAGTNVIHLIPHNAVRRRVFGTVNRAPTAEELGKMEALVEKGMKEGAWGMSTGLVYTPGTWAKTAEIVALAKVVGKHGGLYASHIRSESSRLLVAITEAIEIGDASGCPVHISHLKCSTKAAWGKMEQACGLIEKARERGLQVSADQYPYTASSTSLAAFTIPSWAREGGRRKLIERLNNPEDGAKIRSAIAKSFERRGGAQNLMIAYFGKNPGYNGKRLDEIARLQKKDPVDVVVEIQLAGGAQGIGFSMREEDMLVAMKKSFVATASDGVSRVPSTARPHPRNFGTFPRKIGRYAIEKKALELEFAVRSCSGLPADILGLTDRGYLKSGHKADLVVFEPGAFRDRATFDDPNQYSTGARWVLVNGVAVIADGSKADALPGRPLRRPGK